VTTGDLGCKRVHLLILLLDDSLDRNQLKSHMVGVKESGWKNQISAKEAKEVGSYSGGIIGRWVLPKNSLFCSDGAWLLPVKA